MARFAKQWIIDRKQLGLTEWLNDSSRLRDYVLPIIGNKRLDEVRAKHIVDIVTRMRRKGKAPKTVRNVYSALKAMFRDAQLGDLIDGSPCILTKYQLGENEDKDPEWREGAVYQRGELEALISDSRIPWDRRVLYALQGIAGCRHGEAAGLRWRHYEPSLTPLGKVLIATSYNKGRTKTKRTRRMPVHPLLAAILVEWRKRGWPELMGRPPAADDLICPMPESRRIPLGKMRTKNDSWKRLQKDLRLLGFRARRGHDLRRTMISLARTDGARKDLLEICTHTPKKDTIDLYTEFPWDSLCAEISKMKISCPLEPLSEAPFSASDPPDPSRLATPVATPI